MSDEKSSSYRWIALVIIVMGTFMALLDSSIVNIGVPKMMAVFNVPLNDVQWVLTAYTLTIGAVVPLTGFFQEKFGSKKVYICALVIFTIGSFLCGIAWSNTSMIAFRVLQAFGGGMIMPVGMTIIFKIFPPRERGMASGFWGIAAMAAPAIGPTFGGYIIEKLNWRLIFNVNVPIGIITIILAVALLNEFPHKTPPKVDFLGFIFSTVGIVSILYVLSQNPIDWKDIKNPVLIIIGVFSLILFIIDELTSKEPLLNLRILKNLKFTMTLSALVLVNMVLMGGVYALPLFLQRLKGYTAMQAGMFTLASALITAVIMPISGRAIDKINPKLVIIPGLIVLTISSYELATINLSTSQNTIQFFYILRGIGMGFSMMPLSTTSMNFLPRKLITAGTTIQNTFRQIAGSISVIIMTLSLTNKTDLFYYRLSEQVTPFNQAAVSILNGRRGESTIISILIKQASVDAFDYILMLCAIFAFTSLILTSMMRTKKRA